MRQTILDRYPQMRRLKTRFLQRCIAVIRLCRLVRAPVKFVIGEMRGGTAAYRLDGDPARTVVLRHKSRDIEIFDEIFRRPGVYEPPTEAGALLREIATGQALRVLDLGGNIGLFGVDVLSRFPSAMVTSYEPDPENARMLTYCAFLNGGAKWQVVRACAMPADGPVRLAAGRFADSHVNDEGDEVVGVDVLPKLAEHHYVKMDIEGSEWPILGDRRWADAMREVAVFVLEWHTRACASADPRQAAISAVVAAGFAWEASEPGWDHGTLWGWRSPTNRTGGAPQDQWQPRMRE